MTTEQLTGLQLAVKLLAQIGNDDSDRAIAAVHHAADQAQRIAELERHVANIVSESEAKIPAAQKAFEERLTLDRANRMLVAKNAELEAERNELIDQRDRGDAQNDMLLAELRQVNTERDALRARLAKIEAQEPVADGARFRWLCEDHSDRETRERCRSLIDRLPVMSYSDAVMSIDAAMAAAPEHNA